MANPQEFSHITVTADDDDVVIQAGAVEGTVAGRAAASGADAADASDAADAFDAADASDVGDAADGAADTAASEVVGDAAAGGADKTAASSYRETTLEDLKAAKMSATQKVIIVVAVLGVVAFAVWYLLAR